MTNNEQYTPPVEKMFSGDSRLTNVKLYPGTSNDTTATKVGEQVLRVFAEIENNALEVVELDD